MKTPDQIYHHIYKSKFSDEDWLKVKEYCRTFDGGIQIKKASFPKSSSTFEAFMQWLDKGFGSGEIVRYGNTLGLVGDSFPDKTYLEAYLDFEGNVIINEMEVIEPQRLIKANNDEVKKWAEKFFKAGFDYDVKNGRVLKIPELDKGLYYKTPFSTGKDFQMGMFKEVKDNKYHFIGYSDNGKIIPDYSFEINNTPLRLATEKDIVRFHNQLDRQGFLFDEKAMKLLKKSNKRRQKIYWYVNELFQVICARDNGTKQHQERFLARNYFTDSQLATDFSNRIQKIREED